MEQENLLKHLKYIEVGAIRLTNCCVKIDQFCYAKGNQLFSQDRSTAILPYIISQKYMPKYINYHVKKDQLWC